MKANDLLKFETNSQIYKRLLKFKRESSWEIKCSHCPYHKRDNKGWHNMLARNWKRYRKHQYREVENVKHRPRASE